MIEGIWNKLKQKTRLENDTFRTRKDAMDALQRNWRNIPLSSIRLRTDEMPERCAMVVEREGLAMKTKLW